jgi:aminocarboxymuconate-semialdehyde decarboxylase
MHSGLCFANRGVDFIYAAKSQMEYPLPPKPYPRCGTGDGRVESRRYRVTPRIERFIVTSKEHAMRNRRQFVKTVVGATAGIFATGNRFLDELALGAADPQAAAPAQTARREVRVGGKRVKVVDVHAHATIPEVANVVKDTPLERNAGGGGRALGADRLAEMDKRGIDVQALDINTFWWYAAADRKAHPDRFVAFTSPALQFPDLAVQQLDHAVKNLGMRGAAIGGHVQGVSLSDPKFDPFWAKAEELGVLVFMHPGGADNVIKMGGLEGKGDLGNIIGNPLETTLFFSQLIFNGTLDKFPGLKICGAHGGGYLPSYLGRTEVACDVRANAKCVNKKKPDEYFHQQLLADSMVFSPEGVRHLVAELGPSQVVYGTDIPLVWPDTIDAILGAQIPDAQKEAVLGGNLIKLLKIS